MDKILLNTMKDKVRGILYDSVKSRNSDASLVANYWWKYDQRWLRMKSEDIEKAEPCLPLWNYEHVTQPSVIERARRLVQEEAVLSGDITEMGKYLPTDPAVLKSRRINCKIWKDVINDNKIEFILNYGKQTS